MELLNESQKKISSQVSVNVSRQDVKQEIVDSYLKFEKGEIQKKPNAYLRVVPDQKLLKLIVGQQSAQNSFQNVFLNLIPTNTTNTVQDNNISRFVVQNPNAKDANRNVFLNINNTFQRFIPIPQNITKPPAEEVNLSKILTESKTEELSVEIDPTDFGCMSEESPVTHTTDHVEKDWEELITGTKIHAAADATLPRLVPLKSQVVVKEPETVENNDGRTNNILNNYVPILPKPNPFLNSSEITNEEKYEFFNGGHFLTPKDTPSISNDLTYPCELCDRNFDTLKVLRYHIKQFHLGKFPYKCDFCFSEFAARSMYDLHMEKHKSEGDSFITKESLTLQDFPTTDLNSTKPPAAETTTSNETNAENDGDFEFACDMCTSAFSSENGLFRHKARKHNQKNKKKYFIKGMKNARCDICNRDFSTQSYLQLHKKLHLRNGPNYKGKVFRNKYAIKTVQNNSDPQDSKKSESIQNEVDITIVKKTSAENENVTVVPKNVNCNNDTTEPNLKANNMQSLKIKINLKNLKQSSESMDDDSNSLNGNDEPEIEMETDDVDNIEEGMEEDEEEEDVNPDFKVTAINDAPFLDVSLDYKDSATEYLYCLEADDESSADALNENPLKSGKVSLKCVYCKEGFDKMEDLKLHVNSVHIQSMQYKCHLCNNTFYKIPHLTKHLQIHFSSASCTLCQRMFSLESTRQFHNNSSHSDTAFWQCSVCYNLLNETESVKDHMLNHDCKMCYKCQFCEDEFTDPTKFSMHIVAHNGLYSCNVCQMKFNDEDEKNIHDNDVHKTKTYLCDICHHSYKKIHELTRHSNLHQHHPHTIQTDKNREYENFRTQTNAAEK